MENFLKDYLNKIGMNGNYSASKIPCEICSSEENTIIRENVSLGNNEYTKLPVVSCNNCGYIFQNPRFNEKFYDDFYSNKYRDLLFKKKIPSNDFIDDQISRGQILFKFLEKHIVSKGNLLDVGSSVGGMMIPFINNGWQALGTDPDKEYVEFGKKQMNLPVEDVKAEKMKLEDDFFDLIIIMGSLEHVYDPNKTLSICKQAAKDGSLILIEGRGHPQSSSKTYFNQNHHRYFTFNSMELILLKYGWKPILITDEPICGPSRPGGIYCLGLLDKKLTNININNIINSGKREIPSEIIEKFDELDSKHGIA
tara:strand:- start:2187 stop:3116 length:930 start_codon:yes stop_codon:yes gene_type:complete